VFESEEGKKEARITSIRNEVKRRCCGLAFRRVRTVANTAY